MVDGEGGSPPSTCTGNPDSELRIICPNFVRIYQNFAWSFVWILSEVHLIFVRVLSGIYPKFVRILSERWLTVIRAQVVI